MKLGQKRMFLGDAWVPILQAWGLDGMEVRAWGWQPGGWEVPQSAIHMHVTVVPADPCGFTDRVQDEPWTGYVLVPDMWDENHDESHILHMIFGPDDDQVMYELESWFTEAVLSGELRDRINSASRILSTISQNFDEMAAPVHKMNSIYQDDTNGTWTQDT